MFGYPTTFTETSPIYLYETLLPKMCSEDIFTFFGLYCRYRLVWLAFVLGASAVAIFNCEERVTMYLSHPFQMIETFEPQGKIPFPSVTICNAFPLPLLGAASQLARSTVDKAKRGHCYNSSTEREHIASVVCCFLQSFLVCYVKVFCL